MDTTTNIPSTPGSVEESIKNRFISDWETTKIKQRKLEFYNTVKPAFGEELYLASANFQARKSIARLRSSSHDLNIERGRYKSGYRILDRLCRFCCKKEDQLSSEILLHTENLPFYEPILETEAHMITECPAYHHLRMGLSDPLTILVLQNDYGSIMNNPNHLDEFSLYLLNCYKVRHPKAN